jgi:hypothetical protein
MKGFGVGDFTVTTRVLIGPIPEVRRFHDG